MADNEDMRRNWTEGAAGWVANEELFDAIFTPVTAAILDAAALTPGSRVLDVGCGTGTLLVEATRAGAAATGVDISPVMVEAARRRVPEAAIVVADAQSVDLGALAPAGGFDAVVSRFGVMFFADPVAAFANLGGVSASDGRLVFVCWRGHDENPMFSLGTEVLTAPMADPPTPAPADAPGPSAFADPERLTRLLTDAGWRDIGVEPLDFTCDYGTDGCDGVERRLAGILATTTGRLAREALLPELGADGWAALLDDVRADLRDHLVDGVVRFPGACWLVTATHPADDRR